MNEYRITKYNPRNRVNGRYQKNEWTSISDVGNVFDNEVLSLEEYLRTENSYIECCISLIELAGISCFSIIQPEVYSDDLHLPNFVTNIDNIREIIKWCLREKCWAKLEDTHFYIHFGYDYYMYIGTDLPISKVEPIAQKYKLYCEYCHSPYYS